MVGSINLTSYQRYILILRIVLSIRCKEMYKNMHVLKFYVPICFQTTIHLHHISIVLKSCVPKTILFRCIMKVQKNFNEIKATKCMDTKLIYWVKWRHLIHILTKKCDGCSYCPDFKIIFILIMTFKLHNHIIFVLDISSVTIYKKSRQILYKTLVKSLTIKDNYDITIIS